VVYKLLGLCTGYMYGAVAAGFLRLVLSSAGDGAGGGDLDGCELELAGVHCTTGFMYSRNHRVIRVLALSAF
jgi:hypothetical protein